MLRSFYHNPVLLNEVLNTFNYLKDCKNPVFVDGTIGLAGHSSALILNLKPHVSNLKTIGIDKDEKAIREAELRIKNNKLSKYFTFIHDDFGNYGNIIHNMNIDKVDGILLDLGVSSMQLDEKERGFSFQNPEQPLDMRMNQKQTVTAAEIVNTYSLIELKRVFKYAEEKYYKNIAENICQMRKAKKIKNVDDLLKILKDSIPAGVRARSKKHFATNTFRGLRIETNDELSGLADTLKNMARSLKFGGRIVVISFHSTEDRIVKHVFKGLANPCACPREFPRCVCNLTPEVKILTKKPIKANKKELTDNPRARSAKLRVAERL